MSAPPNGASNSARPAGAVLRAPSQQPVQKQPSKTNIFNTRKPGRRPPPPGQRPPPRAPPAQAPSTSQQPAAPQKNVDEDGTYDEFPIIIEKHQLEAGMRFHAFKLQTRVGPDGKPTLVNPYDDSQFPRPVRLLRRYGTDKMETAEQSEGTPGPDDKERELALARQAERQAEREENKKLIAPTGGEASRPAKKKQQKKVEEGRDDSDPVRQKRRQLRYEEAKRWHLEDKQGKNIWVGNYEEALSEGSILLSIENSNFRVLPIERWYKFIPTNSFKTMTSEEVEKFLAKKGQMTRWAMRLDKRTDQEKKEDERKAKVEERRAMIRDPDEKISAFDGEYEADRDNLDLELNDEFQDDDEGALFQADEPDEAKEIERKIWDEMRNAGLGGTGVKNEELDPEEEERKRAIEDAEERKKSKRLRRQLRRREHKGEYDSDSDSENLWGESSDSDDEEDDEKKEEKKEDPKTANGDKSGASSRGANTPSGRPEKRPNPDTSDASGNESSRKRVKGINGSAVPASGSHGGARSLSPDSAQTKKVKGSRSGAGSGSGSDTDTSRVGRPKLKTKQGLPGSQPSNTPGGSRAGSPSASGSRAQSPKPNGAASDGFPSLEEVVAAIPEQGIRIPDLVVLFKRRVGKRTNDFIRLVKAAGFQNKEKMGLIFPKSAEKSPSPV